MNDVDRIRGFLLQKPKPSTVRVLVDGQARDLPVTRASYRKNAETIDALDGERIECLDSTGKLLRALRLDDEQEREEQAERAAREPVARRPAPALPAGLEKDPQALMLSHFADLIHRAYEHSTELAFNKMVDVFAAMNERSQSIEERLERSESMNRKLVNDQVDDAFERAEEVAQAAGQAGQGGELVQQLAGAFLSGQLQKKSQTTPPNGKGHS